MKRNTFAVILALMITLVGCGGKDGGITRAEGSHTYEGYPIVYVTPDISAQGILTAYESLEASIGSNVAIKLSSTEKDPGFAWSELICELCQTLDDPDIVETDADMDFSKYDYTIVLSHFRSHAEVGFNGTIKQAALMFASPEEMSRLADGQSEQEMLANLGKRTADAMSGHILYISVMDRLSMESAGIVFPKNQIRITLASWRPMIP